MNRKGVVHMAKINRTPAERAAEIDKKIKAHQDAIVVLEAKKEEILHPKKKPTMKSVMEAAKKAGMKPEEMLEKLGLKTEN